MAHNKLFDEIVQELLSVLFDSASYFKDSHASRNHSNIICMAWEWIQGQTRRLKLKTIDHEKSFFRNTSQTALEVIELAFDERCLQSLDLFLNPLCCCFFFLDGIEKAIGLIKFCMVIYSRVLGQELDQNIHLYRRDSRSSK